MTSTVIIMIVAVIVTFALMVLAGYFIAKRHPVPSHTTHPNPYRRASMLRYPGFGGRSWDRYGGGGY
jgi:hypothetical protein